MKLTLSWDSGLWKKMLWSSPCVTFPLNKDFTSPTMFSRPHHDSTHSQSHIDHVLLFFMWEEVSASKPFAGGQLLNGIQRAIHMGICKSTAGLQIPSLVFPARQYNTEPCRQLHKQLDVLGPWVSWTLLLCLVNCQQRRGWRKCQFGFQSISHISITPVSAAAKRGDDSCWLPWSKMVYLLTEREKTAACISW